MEGELCTSLTSFYYFGIRKKIVLRGGSEEAVKGEEEKHSGRGGGKKGETSKRKPPENYVKLQSKRLKGAKYHEKVLMKSESDVVHENFSLGKLYETALFKSDTLMSGFVYGLELEEEKIGEAGVPLWEKFRELYDIKKDTKLITYLRQLDYTPVGMIGNNTFAHVLDLVSKLRPTIVLDEGKKVRATLSTAEFVYFCWLVIEERMKVIERKTSSVQYSLQNYTVKKN